MELRRDSKRWLTGSLTAAVALVAMAAVGCGPSSEVPKQPGPTPKVQGLEKTSFAIGEEFTVTGQNFAPTNGRTKVKFQGEFLDSNGEAHPVNFTAPLAVEEGKNGEQIGKWLRFGPFKNPFARGETGHFEGTIKPVNEVLVGEGNEKSVRSIEGEGKATRIDVEPSIEIVELQPKGAKCGEPAIRGLAGTPYRLKVRAVGFKPDSFGYRISSLTSQKDKPLDAVETFEHQATGPTDVLGDEQTLQFKQVPNDTKHYIAGIQVRATDSATGHTINTFLPFSIHRPVELDYTGELEVAQHYEPKPVTACIPGTIDGTATYQETETETRQQTLSVGISRNWSESRMASNTSNWEEGYGITDTSSSTTTNSESTTSTETTARTSTDSYNESNANSFNYSSSKGESWRVGNEAGVEVGTEGGASVPLLAEAKVSVTGHYNRSWGKSGSTEKTKNWGQTTTKGRSKSLSNSYTLSNSSTSTTSKSNTQARSKSRTYNFGKSATMSERVSQGITEDEQQTWTESKSSSTLTGFSGYIPVNKYGVFYRQTIRMVRRAKLKSYNACGEVEKMGEIQMNEWNWAPDLATGDSCGSKLPDSNLPPAKCHIPPCD